MGQLYFHHLIELGKANSLFFAFRFSQADYFFYPGNLSGGQFVHPPLKRFDKLGFIVRCNGCKNRFTVLRNFFSPAGA